MSGLVRDQAVGADEVGTSCIEETQGSQALRLPTKVGEEEVAAEAMVSLTRLTIFLKVCI